MKTVSALTALIALSAIVGSTAADARGGRGGHGFRAAGLHVGGVHRFHGPRYHHRRAFHVGFVAPVYDGYCKWYRTPYGPVKRCFY